MNVAQLESELCDAKMEIIALEITLHVLEQQLAKKLTTVNFSNEHAHWITYPFSPAIANI